MFLLLYVTILDGEVTWALTDFGGPDERSHGSKPQTVDRVATSKKYILYHFNALRVFLNMIFWVPSSSRNLNSSFCGLVCLGLMASSGAKTCMLIYSWLA